MMTERNDEIRPIDMAAGQRAEWVEPTVKRLNADAAELNVGGVDDGVDKS
jgi:hypothetical protein